MLVFRRWQRLLAVSIVGFLFFYAVLYHDRSSWPATPSMPWDGARSSADGPAGGAQSGLPDNNAFTSPVSAKIPPAGSAAASASHPIDRLIADGRAQFKALLGRRSLTLDQAASRYRERRQRHPPPGFDAWFAAARDADAVVVENFFDRIHDDLAPLWALDPATMRRQASTQPQLIRVRNGTAWFETDNPHRPPWIQHWGAFVEEFAAHLPDLDMVLNIMDETRLLVPWDTVRDYVQTERRTRRMPAPHDTLANFSGLAETDRQRNLSMAAGTPYQHSWITNDAHRFWDHLRAACPPTSPARNVPALSTFLDPITYPAAPNPLFTTDGYISNVSAARDPCLQPHLRDIHGTFIEGLSMSTSHELMPMFAGCKLQQNNEILIPGAMYLTEDPFYSGGETHGVSWAEKNPGLVWRGTASGGRNKADNWWHFHRHRWVQMTNSTTLKAVEDGYPPAPALAHLSPAAVTREGPTFALPTAAAAVYNVPAQKEGRLASWVGSWADVGFVDLECFPLERDENNTKILTCDYTSPHVAVLPGKPMAEQYDYKFLPDVDGNSYSARWRSFLRSTSMPLKATIYAEWHDDRLVPWAHYAPLDTSYMDLYGVMDYFLSHDAEAERIADESRRWAEAALRRVDMRLYVWRLLLEYARVVDDNRERLAFVADLMD